MGRPRQKAYSNTPLPPDTDTPTMSSSVTYLPPTSPDPLSQVPTRKPNLTAEQTRKLTLLIQHLNGDAFALPGTVKEARAAQKWRTKQLAKGDKEFNVPTSWLGRALDAGDATKNKCKPLDDEEKVFLTSEQCQRFLRAVKWDLAAAFSRAEETMTWRREFEVRKLNENPSIIDEEAQTGKEVLLGWDIQKRPCLYMYPWRQNTKTSDRQIQFVVWCLERALDLMPPNVENLCLLIDFGTGAKGSSQPTSLGQAKKFLEIVQTYYGERLGRAVCINVPMLFWGFYRLVGPFVDPVTKDKIRFNPDVRTLVPPGQLDKEDFGGDLNFQYKHEEYFPYLDKMCADAREAKMRRWRERGEGKCGMSEFIIKGGMEALQNEQEAETLGKERTDIPAVAALSNGDAQSSKMSPATSTTSAGFQLPPEANSAPDWNEPGTSGVEANGGDGKYLAAAGMANGNDTRPRANSSDSFVSAKEIPAGSSGPVKARDDDLLESRRNSLPNANGNALNGNVPAPVSTDNIEVGIKGLP